VEKYTKKGLRAMKISQPLLSVHGAPLRGGPVILHKGKKQDLTPIYPNLQTVKKIFPGRLQWRMETDFVKSLPAIS